MDIIYNFILDYITAVYIYVHSILFNTTPLEKILLILPYILFEFPYLILSLFLLTLKYKFGFFQKKKSFERFPKVSTIITAYNEGEDVKISVNSILEQDYQGHIEIIVVVDGARVNIETYKVAKRLEKKYKHLKNRSIKVIPKWERGGRASSLNLGLKFVTGEVVYALDGDTSFDRDMISNSVAYMVGDDKIIAMAGNIRVRNWNKSLVTKFQAIEYSLSIYMFKQVLEILGTLNNIAGAFGIFRKRFIDRVSGWDAGTAEDLDLTLRMKKFKNIYKKENFKIVFAEDSIGLTDVPDTWKKILIQRLRWDGDLVFIYFRKHRNIFDWKVMGIREVLYLFFSSLLQQFILPLLTIIYYIIILINLGFLESLAILTFIYIIYAIHTFILFLFFVIFISERKEWDKQLIIYSLLYPIYGFLIRINSLYAYIEEIFFEQHRHTPYVPPWVAKRMKF